MTFNVRGIKVGDKIKWLELLYGSPDPKECTGIVLEVHELGLLVEDLNTHSPVYVKYSWITD